ncbi:MAG TPA: hypothetical protein PLV85_01275, partial [Polyangiaceae bacterium]|nr:hypothetical protein [Polyangiaceae bacterium]
GIAAGNVGEFEGFRAEGLQKSSENRSGCRAIETMPVCGNYHTLGSTFIDLMHLYGGGQNNDRPL